MDSTKYKKLGNITTTTKKNRYTNIEDKQVVNSGEMEEVQGNTGVKE